MQHGETAHDTPGLSPERLDLALRESPAYLQLQPAAQEELLRSMSKVLGYIAKGGDAARPPAAPARPFAPDLSSLRGPGGGTGSPGGPGGPLGQFGPPGGPSSQGPGQPPAPPPGQPAGGDGSSVFSTAAGATREMLGAVGFPDFVASLIQGTFQAIVDSSIQQMEAYSNLLAETAKTVDIFMEDNVTDDMARDHLVNNYGDVFVKDLSAGSPELKVDTQTAPPGGLPSFLSDLGFDSPMDIDGPALEEVVIPNTRRTLAEMRHQSLATMVMMGINRIVVSDGEINAKLVFHIDAAESMDLTFSDYKPTSWNMAGQLGTAGFGAAGLLVNTTSLNAQSGVNMQADLTGEVRVRFRSDYFPLERFADSGAIQLINSHAKVADPRANGAANQQPGGTPPAPNAVGVPPLPAGSLLPPTIPGAPEDVLAPPAPAAADAPAASQQSLRRTPHGGRR